MNKINEIREAVLEYINNVDTDFAIMIDGEWGSGKTHFWKNEIAEPINKLQQDDLRELANTLTSFKLVQNNHSFHRLNRSFPKNKKIIYISLYGLNKLEDIDNNITMKLLTPEGIKSFEKYIPRLDGLINSGLSLFSKIPAIPFMELARLTSVKDEIFKLMKENKLDKNFNEIILCFDDLERSSLQIDLVLGYINRFVEHNNIKTIVICNESEINKENEKYKQIKEKLIGFTYRYEPSIEEVIQNFIEPYIDLVKDRINDNLRVIQDIIARSGCNNLRTIKQSLSLVNKIISCYFEKDNPQEVTISISYRNYYDFNVISEIIKFVFCLNFEIKIGIGKEDLSEIKEFLKDLQEYNILMSYVMAAREYDQKKREEPYKSKLILNENQQNENISLVDKPYVINFLEKYYDFDYQLQFWPDKFPPFSFLSIYEFLTSGYFRKDLFQQEIEQNCVIKVNPKRIFLDYEGYQEISDEDFDEVTNYYINQFKNLEELAFKNFQDILRLTRHLLIISNQRLIQETPEEIKKIILLYLDKIEENKSQLEPIDSKVARYKDDPIDSLIVDKVKKINDDVIKIKKHKEISDIINLQKDFFANFRMKAISLDKNNETIFTILNQLDIELLAQKIVKLPNYDINNFQTFFDYKEIFISERSNLTILRNLLSEHIEKSETRKLSLVLIEELIEKIDEYIKKIETNSDSYS